MANETIMQGLLESLLQRPQQQDQGAVLANLISQPNATAALTAYMMPQRMANVGQAARGMFNIPEQVAPQQNVQQLLINNPTLMNSSAGLAQLAQQAGAAGDQASALRFTVMAQQAAQAEAQAAMQAQAAMDQASKEQQKVTDAESQRAQAIAGLEGVVNNASITDSRRAALLSAVRAGLFNSAPDKLMTAAFPEGTDEYKVVGNNVFNTKTGSWMVPPSAQSDTESGEMPSGIDPDQYDPASFGQYEAAIKSAQTSEDRKAAYGLLLPKAQQGFQWKTINNTLVEYPVGGPAMAKVRGEVSAANRARENALSRAQRGIETVDGILSGVASGQAKPGAAAGILGYVPGTPYWNQRVSLDTLKANLGISALFEARETSPNGSSGFGQLTQRELDRLESLLAPLSVAQTEQAFVSALGSVREELGSILSRDQGSWDLDKYLGVPSTQVDQPATTITAPSGSTYIIRARN